MDHLNLRGYLRNNRDIGRLELVRLHRHIPRYRWYRHQLRQVTRGLSYMHRLDIVYENLEIVGPILTRRF